MINSESQSSRSHLVTLSKQFRVAYVATIMTGLRLYATFFYIFPWQTLHHVSAMVHQQDQTPFDHQWIRFSNWKDITKLTAHFLITVIVWCPSGCCKIHVASPSINDKSPQLNSAGYIIGTLILMIAAAPGNDHYIYIWLTNTTPLYTFIPNNSLELAFLTCSLDYLHHTITVMRKCAVNLGMFFQLENFMHWWSEFGRTSELC